MVELARGAEVDYLQLRVGVVAYEDNVLGLQVPVDDVLLVAVHDCKQDLADVVSGYTFTERGHLLYTIEKLAPREVFGHEVVVSLILEELVQPDDVWMIKIL